MRAFSDEDFVISDLPFNDIEMITRNNVSRLGFLC